MADRRCAKICPYLNPVKSYVSSFFSYASTIQVILFWLCGVLDLYLDFGDLTKGQVSSAVQFLNFKNLRGENVWWVQFYLMIPVSVRGEPENINCLMWIFSVASVLTGLLNFWPSDKKYLQNLIVLIHRNGVLPLNFKMVRFGEVWS